ncbi:MAG: hypothetical protein IT553_08775 [Sphingomonadaceae bacterium]|nr:hypothetical protein [Sphingomonadaceae bacterium]
MRRLFLTLGLFFALMGAGLHVEAVEHPWSESAASQMAHQANGDTQDGSSQKSADHGSICHHHCPNAALDATRSTPFLTLVAMRPTIAGAAPLGGFNSRPPIEPPAA